MSKRNIILGFIVLIIIVLAIFAWQRLGKNVNETKAEIKKFAGSVVKIEGADITLNGVYVVTSGSLSEELSSKRQFTFHINGTTNFIKNEVQLPSFAELEASGRSNSAFEMKDLPKVQTSGSLGDLKSYTGLNPNIVNLIVDFNSSIENTENPLATTVFYQIMSQNND